MTVCLDTNIFLQIFGRKQPYYPIFRALLDGRLTLAVSNEILFEYEEVITRLSGAERWLEVAALLERLERQNGNIRKVQPHFRFGVVTQDPDDNKFCDCAISAEANFVVTDDAHFAGLQSAGYKPKPIAPQDFIGLI